MAGASGEQPVDTGVREPSSATGFAEQPADLGGSAAAPPARVYRPVSLLAVFALILGVLYGVVVLVGGVIPFSRAYPQLFVLLFLLAPIGGIIGAVATRQKGVNRYLAIAGLAWVGVLVLMGLGGLVAFSSMAPWMLPNWLWLLLGASVLVSLIAISRIRAAEGALAGAELARWGLWMGLFFGGYYLLYLYASQLAVTNQAQTAADQFLNHIRDDEMHQAFAQTLKPGTRPDAGAGLAKEIETVYDAPRGVSQPGEFTTFCHTDFTQRIRLGGKGELKPTTSAVEYTSEGENKGYKAVIGYELTNDLGRFDLEIRLLASESGGTRKWQVAGPSCRITRMHEQSQRGQQVEQAAYESQAVLNNWINNIRSGRHEWAYLMTLPPEHRPPLQHLLLLKQPGVSVWAGLGPKGIVANRSREVEAVEAGVKEFKTGKILDTANFLKDDPDRRETVLRELRALFAGSRLYLDFAPVSVPVPTAKVENDECEVVRLVRFAVPEERSGPPRYAIEGVVVIRGPLSRASHPDRRLRIISFQLRRLAALALEGPPPPQ